MQIIFLCAISIKSLEPTISRRNSSKTKLDHCNIFFSAQFRPRLFFIFPNHQLQLKFVKNIINNKWCHLQFVEKYQICLVSHFGVYFGNNEKPSTHIGPSTEGRWWCQYSRPLMVAMAEASLRGRGLAVCRYSSGLTRRRVTIFWRVLEVCNPSASMTLLR